MPPRFRLNPPPVVCNPFPRRAPPVRTPRPDYGRITVGPRELDNPHETRAGRGVAFVLLALLALGAILGVCALIGGAR